MMKRAEYFEPLRELSFIETTLGRIGVRFYQETDSTNQRAKEEPATGTSLYIALQQREGKGRFSRKWYSPPRTGLYGSFLFLKPSLTHEISFAPLAAAVAVARVLENTGIGVQLKWPNDIQHNGRKLAGILTETVFSGMQPERLIIGLGVNLFHPSGIEGAHPHFPEDDASLSPVFLEELLEDIPPCTLFLEELAESLQQALFRDTTAYLINEWEKRCPFIGKLQKFCIGGECSEGKITGLDKSGALIAECGDERKLLNSGTVTFRSV